MKRSRQLALVAIAQTPLLLAGCDNQPAQPQQLTKQGFYTSVDACERDGNSAEMCQRASASANSSNTAAAPKYRSKAECIQEYGDLCSEREHESGIWMPLMTGFMISQMLSPGRAPMYIDSNPIYRTRSGQYSAMYRDASGGFSSGTMRPVEVAPNRAVTTSRSGFGSSSAARSGWGGSSGASSSGS